VTEPAGAAVVYGSDAAAHPGLLASELIAMSGGVAAGDYDADGWVDLYAVGGELGQTRLLRNRGDGTFEDRTVAAGVGLPGALTCGPTFADYDGDGWLDLLVGGHLGTPLTLLRNRGDGTFEDVTAGSGLTSATSNFSSAFGDYDGDGDLDLAVSHWASNESFGPPVEHLWRNEGNGGFVPATVAAGVDPFLAGRFGFTWTFTPSFADLTNDGRLDLLLASDFGTEQVYWNDGDGTFTDATTAVNSSENGMGSAVGDYDNDGDLDWFVTSILDADGTAEGNWGVTGNRLYRNRGDGRLEDVTDAAGVRLGYWGWAACFADFNLDGHLDLFHVNGFDSDSAMSVQFHDDPSLFYVANGDGTFTDRSADVGLSDVGQGRGVVCFDYDRDGDVDIYVGNGEGQASRLYRNDAGVKGGYLAVALRGPGANTQAIGARVLVTTGMRRQMRELAAGGNFVSQNPPIAHFGLGEASSVERLEVEWPDGGLTTMTEVATNQLVEIVHPDRP
jgi:hypothetical protein